MTGIVSDFQHLSINDGPGIRTIVFLKGCPLRCAWCHNPEMQSIEAELAFEAKRCILCGACQAACPQGCHEITSKGHSFLREGCVHCGACAKACPSALELRGRRMSVASVVEELLADAAFYESSGGGITLSGGEPLLQAEFSLQILSACKEAGIHTCVETCSYAPWSQLERFIPVTDLFLCDWKMTDEAAHKRWTGVSNRLIGENIKRLSAAGAHIRLRCPIIPSVNDETEHFKGIAELANSLKGIERIELMPYHDVWRSKAEAFGHAPKSVFTPPSQDMVSAWIAEIQKRTDKEVVRG